MAGLCCRYVKTCNLEFVDTCFFYVRKPLTNQLNCLSNQLQWAIDRIIDRLQTAK